MRRKLKIAAVLMIGLFVLIVGIGTNAEIKADSTDIRPSQWLQSLTSEYGVNLPQIPNQDCSDFRYLNKGRISKIVASLAFNDNVDKARSAEAAAIAYKQQGDEKMAAIAISDAAERWNRVFYLKADMNCYDIQAKRSAY